MGGKVQGLRSTNLQVQNRQGDVKNSRGNGVVKELICMTHEQEPRQGGLLEGMGVPGGGQRGENQDNYNSIINKIHCKKERLKLKVLKAFFYLEI